MLRLRSAQDVQDHFSDALLEPLEDFFSRPGKNVRGKLVELGFRLAADGKEGSLSSREAEICGALASMLEAIHAGSLIVDDIEDGSRLRRGEQTLHLRYGTPVALNAGNFLYFLSLQRLSGLGLDPAIELSAYRLCHEALLRAHFGQALDVGVGIHEVPQDRVLAVSLASLELKSGALMAMAIALGALAGGASPERMAALDEFGHCFGVALQMFDDLGNLRALPDVSPEVSKRFEDLYLRRPSWVWGAAARTCGEREYREFVDAVVKLPDESFLVPWIEIHDFVPKAKALARGWLEESISSLIEKLGGKTAHASALADVRELAEKVAHAYD